MATATKKSNKKKKGKPASEKVLTKEQFEERKHNLPKGTLARTEQYIRHMRAKEKRSYNDPTVTKEEYKLLRDIAQYESYVFCEYVFNGVARNGMTIWDLLNRRNMRDCVKEEVKSA